MALTVTNTESLNLLSIINNITRDQSQTLERLSTGFKTGLIALSSLQAELTAVDSAIDNGQRADAILSVADGSLQEVASLLTDIESLVAASTSASGLTGAEIAANQSQIDAAIDSIDRIIRTTSFNGKRLLDGSFGIQRSGITTSQITDVKLFSRSTSTSSTTIQVNVQTAAARATFTLADHGGVSNVTSGATQVSIAGSLGTTTVTIASGQTAAQVATTINLSTDLTGVVASSTGGVVYLYSNGYGSSKFVATEVLSGGEINGTSNSYNSSNGNQTGTDASVTVNGQAASVDGLQVSFNVSGISGSFNMTSGFGTQTSQSSSFTVSASGGATFQLGTDSTTRSTIGIDSLFSYKLGGGDTGGVLSDLKSGGSASLTNDVATALAVVKQAISDVATARGRIGGFQKFQVQTTLNSLDATKSGLTDAKSIIGDTDYATETAELNRQQVLLNSSIALLGLANQKSAAVLSLLG
jgi:flagellin